MTVSKFLRVRYVKTEMYCATERGGESIKKTFIRREPTGARI